MAIKQLIYRSTATQCLGPAELDRLVQQARIHNFSQEITGLLLHADHQFLQVLEGEEHVVEEMFAYISQDLRHTKVVALHKGGVSRRLFPEWSLGFGSVNTAALARLAAYLDPHHRAAILTRSSRTQGLIAGLLQKFVAEQMPPRELVSCR